ncbi:MAG TPA: hypothetical protein VFS84_10280 [Candidatus Binatia bacterium]|nr:hypothetical protein [Candidatus Binatia bacterium]
MVNGNVVGIFISPIAGEKMEEVETAEAIAGAGLAGDRYSTGEGSFNKNRQGRRQVSLINAIFFDSSGFEFVESRRNIVTQGIELMWLIGREFQIGKAQFRGQNYCDPCLRPSRLSGKTQKFLESFSDRGGLIAEILQGGTIKKGDLITLHALPHEAYYYRNREPQNK